MRRLSALFGHRHWGKVVKNTYWAVLILRDWTLPQCFIFLDLSLATITLKGFLREMIHLHQIEPDEHL